MPPASRITDAHGCPVHGPTPVCVGDVTVLIGYMPAARVGDILACVPPDVIVEGEPTVLIGHRNPARIGDSTAHRGKLIQGCPTVLIGSSPQGSTLKTNEPFCEECEAKKKAREARRKKGKDA